TGWRRTAVINTTILISLLAVAFQASNNGASKRYFIMFRANCDTVGRIDISLHLLLNAFSTAVLASSNFFMQILNVPTRQEIDHWHSKCGPTQYFFHIGVSSWKNAFRVKRWKTVAWVVLLISSIPINLFFNSAIFPTDSREGEYNMVIAKEDFARGGEFFL
ncbi:hypothetical protein QBC38DRAFT_342817, partial [Podospora fimiseda]